MKRVLLYALMTLLAGAHLPAQPAWAQKRGYDGDGREGGNRASRQAESELERRYGEFSKSMGWELKTGQELAEQIHQIIRQFRPERNTGGHDEEINAQIRELRAELRKANKADDRERAGEFRKQMRKLERKANQSSQDLDPEMFYAIADVLSEPLLTDFWQIAERFTDEERIHSGAQDLELLDGLKLTEEQGVAISLHYKTYLDEVRNADHGSRDSLKAVQTRFRARLMEELNEGQQAAFGDAMETQERESKRKPKETNRRW